MSPFHTGFVRELHTTTALQCSAAWLVSENILALRMAEFGHVERAPSPALQQEIDGAILLSEVKPIIERMN
jgi:hypothetical protein